MKVAVVIPFYQRNSGLLTKALDSVFSQDLSKDVELDVYVVDDESPLSAIGEIEALPPQYADKIILLSQSNGGPGAARNLALEQVARHGADYVAFLDSDDIWRPRHLRDALVVLEQGYDYYFCDHTRFNSEKTYSDSIASLVSLKRNDRGFAQVVDPQGPVMTVAPVFIMKTMLIDYLSQTSTVVLRHDLIKDLRFLPELRGAGEDHFFWISVLSKYPRVAVSWRTNVHCGRGVNVYHSAFDFETVGSTNRIGYLLLFRHKCLNLPIDKEAHQAMRAQVSRYRRAYSFMFIRALLRGQRPDMKLFRMVRERMPFLPATMPYHFLTVIPTRGRQSKEW